MVGNKQDLATQEAIDPTEARDWARNIGGCYFQTSAKENTGVEQVFTSIAELVLCQARTRPDNIRLDDSTLPPLRKGKCCK